MIALKKELKERRKVLVKKIETDVEIYGKPLGNKGLQDKVDATKRKITRLKESMKNHEEKLNQKHKLSNWDNRVLSAIRGNQRVLNTSSTNNYRFDNRFRGSSNSRKEARRSR